MGFNDLEFGIMLDKEKTFQYKWRCLIRTNSQNSAVAKKGKWVLGEIIHPSVLQRLQSHERKITNEISFLPSLDSNQM